MMKEILQSSKDFNLTLSENYLKIANELESLSKNLSKKRIFKFLKETPKGFYIYGSTGSGKTTLMNAFFKEVDTKKINIHFHDYFIDITRLLTKYSMQTLIKKLSEKVNLFCFDEFFIESIADAKLLEDLFEGLINSGITIVLTSNFIPEKLYEYGFNREIVFPKFSNFLKEYLNVLELSSNFDFREEISKNMDTSLICIDLPKKFKPSIFEFQNHRISCLILKNEAIFEYEELFCQPRGVPEFIQICRKFDKIYIANFKPFTLNSEDNMIRFRNFIDIAYIRHNSLALQAKITEEDIFPTKFLENIEIKRAYSRLKEMSLPSFLSPQNLLKRSWQTEARILLETL